MTGRAELDAYFARVPEHVLTVLDQAIGDGDHVFNLIRDFQSGLPCTTADTRGAAGSARSSGRYLSTITGTF